MADIERSNMRGIEDGLAGVPPEEDGEDYREGFADGRNEGKRSNKVTAG